MYVFSIFTLFTCEFKVVLKLVTKRWSVPKHFDQLVVGYVDVQRFLSHIVPGVYCAVFL